MKQMKINQVRKILLKYRSDLQFVNADVMKWNHSVVDKMPPSREALFGYALLKCNDHLEYLGTMLYDQYDDNDELIPDDGLTFSLCAVSAIEAILLSLGFYSWNAIQAARKQVMNEVDG